MKTKIARTPEVKSEEPTLKKECRRCKTTDPKKKYAEIKITATYDEKWKDVPLGQTVLCNECWSEIMACMAKTSKKDEPKKKKVVAINSSEYAGYCNGRGQKITPKHEVTKKLIERIEVVLGDSLIEMKEYQDKPDFAMVSVKSRMVGGNSILSREFKRGNPKDEVPADYAISTDGFGILVREVREHMMMQTAITSLAVYMGNHLNNPDYEEYVIARRKGNDLPL